MSGEFIAALGLDTCKAILNRVKRQYEYSCGLVAAVHTDNLDPAVSILRRPTLLKAAHQRHHDNHFGPFATPPTLYMIGGLTATGRETLAAAMCSCEYDKEHPHA